MAETKIIKILDGVLAGVPASITQEQTTGGGKQIVYTIAGVDVNREAFIVATKFASVMAEQDVSAALAALKVPHGDGF